MKAPSRRLRKVRESKTGRRASDDERAYARHLVDEYRQMKAKGAFTEEGMLCEDGSRQWSNPNMLLFALERFAETGFLRPHREERHAQHLTAVWRIEELRAADPRLSQAEARAVVAEEMATTVSTLERLIGRRSRSKRVIK